MAILSSRLLLQTHSLTLLYFAYTLLAAPERLTSAAPVWVIGESMHLPLTTADDSLLEPSAALALCAIVLTGAAAHQLIFSLPLSPLGETGEKNEGVFAAKVAALNDTITNWMIASGIRTLGNGAAIIAIYLSTLSRRSQAEELDLELPQGMLGFLCNRVVFTACMTDMLFWGWLYTTLKDEGRDLARSVQAWRERAEREIN